jgi:hypothetical protein
VAESLVVEGYLIVKATGDMRVTKRRPGLYMDEVAFPLTVTIPKTWGRVQPTSIDVALPEPPEARVTVGDGELDDPDD